MPVSEKQLGYAKKYMESFEDIKVRVPKGKRETYKKKARDKGKSLNQFIIDLLEGVEK